MYIRKAKQEDIPRILELLSQIALLHHNGRPDLFRIETKYNAEELEEMLPDESRPIFIAAGENDEVLGYGFCVDQKKRESNSPEGVRTLYIDDICVDESCRGQHIGTAIYKAIVAYAKEHHFHNITLHVWDINPEGEKFYKALGMKAICTTMETLLED